MYVATKNPGQEVTVNGFDRPDTSLSDLNYESPYLPGYSVVLTFSVQSDSENYSDKEIVKTGVIALDWEDLGDVIKQEVASVNEGFGANSSFCIVRLENIEFLRTNPACSPRFAKFIVDSIVSVE